MKVDRRKIEENQREALRRDIIEGCREMGEIYLEMAKEWEAADDELWRSFEPESAPPGG